MKEALSVLFRLALPIAALVLLMMLPITDSFFGGHAVQQGTPVYGIIGDADGNGFVDLADADLIRAIARGGQSYDGSLIAVADLNGDGNITADDAGILLLYLSDADHGAVTPDVYYRIKLTEEVRS